ncbi:MAG: hypothetical protein IRZ07_27585 [Microbispora sp.]|nr:hypothetical protein [Microbispora sp.]
MARPAKARVRSGSGSGEKALGRLCFAAFLSWITYVLLDQLTVAPDALATWVSGAMAALALTVRAGRGR